MQLPAQKTSSPLALVLYLLTRPYDSFGVMSPFCPEPKEVGKLPGISVAAAGGCRVGCPRTRWECRGAGPRCFATYSPHAAACNRQEWPTGRGFCHGMVLWSAAVMYVSGRYTDADAA